MLIRGDSGRVLADEEVVEPAVAPAPLPVAPVQVPDAQVVIGVAIDRAPEEDEPRPTLLVGLPVLGDEIGVGEQVVEDIGIEHGLGHQLLPEVVPHDATRPLGWVKVELDLARVEHELTTSLVLDHAPVARNERDSVAVDEATLNLRNTTEVSFSDPLQGIDYFLWIVRAPAFLVELTLDLDQMSGDLTVLVASDSVSHHDNLLFLAFLIPFQDHLWVIG